MNKLLTILIILFCIVAYSQDVEKKKPISINCDLWSRYVWRGTDYGASPSIQPYMSYTKNGLNVGFFGAYSVNSSDFQEVDLYLSYTFYKELFTLMITDYYSGTGNQLTNYFEYNHNRTGHVYEVTVKYNGSNKIPLSMFVATNFYGADVKRNNGNIMYSTYAELTYSFEKIKVFTGFSFMDPVERNNESGYYGNAMGFVNIGFNATKKIKFNENYFLPLTISLVTNPMSEKVFLIAGLTF